MKPKHLEFKVRVPNLPGVTRADWRRYIDDAVCSWCGQAQAPQDEGDEPDPWWSIVCSDRMDEVRVTRLHKPHKTRGEVQGAPLVGSLARFDEAAQTWGWEKDQGSPESARRAETRYMIAKNALRARLIRVQRAIGRMRATVEHMQRAQAALARPIATSSPELDRAK